MTGGSVTFVLRATAVCGRCGERAVHHGSPEAMSLKDFGVDTLVALRARGWRAFRPAPDNQVLCPECNPENHGGD